MTVIYYNPRCSKCRQTLALLQQRGIEPEVFEYLTTPLQAERLGGLIDLLGGDPRVIVRAKEEAYREAGLSDASSRAEVVAAVVANPRLLERPIVVHDGKAALGRPPENVLQLL